VFTNVKKGGESTKRQITDDLNLQQKTKGETISKKNLGALVARVHSGWCQIQGRERLSLSKIIMLWFIYCGKDKLNYGMFVNNVRLVRSTNEKKYVKLVSKNPARFL